MPASVRSNPDPSENRVRSAQSLHDQLLHQATAATGAHLARTREWAFVERVTTGLYLRWFDDLGTAKTFLDSAMVLLGWPPPVT